MVDRFDLSGKRALITGGGRGLGREMAQAFAEHGADVIIASRKLDVLEQTAAEIAEATGRTITAKACHVGEWEQVSRLADEVYAEFGRVDVLVNNAGMSPLYESLSTVTEDLWRKVIDVNLTGPFRLSALVGERIDVDHVRFFRVAGDGVEGWRKLEINLFCLSLSPHDLHARRRTGAATAELQHQREALA